MYSSDEIMSRERILLSSPASDDGLSAWLSRFDLFALRGISRHGKTHYGASLQSPGLNRLISQNQRLKRGLSLWRAV